MTRIRRKRAQQAGFTVIEVLISLTVLLIGIVGVLSMGVGITRESSFSRHTVEASVLGEDMMEKLLSMPVAVLDPGNAGVAIATNFIDSNVLGEQDGSPPTGYQVVGTDCSGACDPPALFTVAWGLVWDTTSFGTLTVSVTWSERGQPYTLTFITQRSRL